MFTPRTDHPVHVDRDDCSSTQLPAQSQHHDNFNWITTQVDTNMDQQNTNPLLPPSEVSPLEQEILDEYERLAENMKTVRVAPPRVPFRNILFFKGSIARKNKK